MRTLFKRGLVSQVLFYGSKVGVCRAVVVRGLVIEGLEVARFVEKVGIVHLKLRLGIRISVHLLIVSVQNHGCIALL